MKLSHQLMLRKLSRILRVIQVIVLIETLHHQVIYKKRLYAHKTQDMVEAVSQGDQEG